MEFKKSTDQGAILREYFYAEARLRQFHAMKIDWGISKFLDLETFQNPSNGYLVNDTCVFGAEIFIVKNTYNMEHLSMMKPANDCHTWKVIAVMKYSNFFRFSSRKMRRFFLYLFGISGNEFVLFQVGSEDETLHVCPAEWIERCYHAMKTEWGITKFIDLELKGYLIDDTCVFGAEGFVVKSTSKRELSMVKEPATYFHTWKLIIFRL
ncbi:hypothetical protein Pint_16586 [Pistacia integerrima]|uniref:Uncharacterized protein n=1 Tax=Pistacia integerrima TaxID=434235 RepID=A0ACC0ZDA7_9ROSI|nr:hypothetical protein Pint_16586 [Pistacia integerrima]